jgi:hypothetical protein
MTGDFSGEFSRIPICQKVGSAFTVIPNLLVDGAGRLWRSVRIESVRNWGYRLAVGLPSGGKLVYRLAKPFYRLAVIRITVWR